MYCTVHTVCCNFTITFIICFCFWKHFSIEFSRLCFTITITWSHAHCSPYFTMYVQRKHSKIKVSKSCICNVSVQGQDSAGVSGPQRWQFVWEHASHSHWLGHYQLRRTPGIVTPLTLTSSISSGGPQVVTPLTLTVAISSGGPQVVTPLTLTVAISSGGPQV